MNVFKKLKSRRSILRHANMAADHDLEFTDTGRPNEEAIVPVACAQVMACEHDVCDESCDCDSDHIYPIDPVVENEIDAVENYPECNDAFAIIEQDLKSDDLDLKLGVRWLGSESEDESDEFSRDTFEQELGEWAVSYIIQHSAVAGLLTILRNQHFPTLPRDPRTLLKTPRQYVIKSVSGGEYSPVGLAKGLSRIVSTDKSVFKQLDIQINIDGIPLFKSTNTSLWPILCSVINSVNREPFVVGLFCGKEKPADAKEFLSEFVLEAFNLLKNGLTFEANNIPVSIHSFVCDAPARAFIKGIKSHSGYSSCEICTVTGEYSGKVIFTMTSAQLRTDEDFNMRTVT